MKKLFIRILSLLFRRNKIIPPLDKLFSHIEQNYLNILIVRQHNQLGDMLLSVPLFKAFKEKFPNSFLSVVSSHENYDAIKSNKYIDEVILFDKRKFKNPLELLRFLKKLRSRRYFIGVVPATVSISFTSNLLCRLAKCDYRIGPNSLNGKYNDSAFLFDYQINLDFRDEDQPNPRHISDKILDIVRPFGIDTSDLQSHILIKEEDENFANDFFGNHNGLKIGLHIGAGKIPNRWNIDNFAILINELVKKYNPLIYLTIGNWEEDLYKQLLGKINISPKVLKNESISRIAAVIDKSNLFISNDTGIMHVAGTTRCPLIALFGATNPKIWSPIGPKKFYLWQSNDVNKVTVNQVLKLAEDILK